MSWFHKETQNKTPSCLKFLEWFNRLKSIYTVINIFITLNLFVYIRITSKEFRFHALEHLFAFLTVITHGIFCSNNTTEPRWKLGLRKMSLNPRYPSRASKQPAGGLCLSLLQTYLFWHGASNLSACAQYEHNFPFGFHLSPVKHTQSVNPTVQQAGVSRFTVFTQHGKNNATWRKVSPNCQPRPTWMTLLWQKSDTWTQQITNTHQKILKQPNCIGKMINSE